MSNESVDLQEEKRRQAKAQFEFQEIQRQQGIEDLAQLLRNKDRLGALFEQFVKEKEEIERAEKRAKLQKGICNLYHSISRFIV
jgi:hypothetical protein